jgi:hypothetical protein
MSFFFGAMPRTVWGIAPKNEMICPGKSETFRTSGGKAAKTVYEKLV